METEDFMAKLKKPAQGFGNTQEEEEDKAQEEFFSDELELEIEVFDEVVESERSQPEPKRHIPLVRPMPRRKAVPQRGSKGASRLRP